MTGQDKKSRAPYFRERRKTNPNRLKDANLDAARKREKRGGYKSAAGQYREFLSRLPADQRENFRVRFEYPDLFFGGVDPAKLAPEKTRRLSMTANARRRRAEEFKRHYEREELQELDTISDAEAREIALANNLDPDEFVRWKHARAHELRQSLKVENKENAAKQAHYRAKNQEKVREAEKHRTGKRRAAEKAAREQAPFIAIDAEGCNIGAVFEICSGNETQALDLGLPESSSKTGSLICQDHRTFLWGACGDSGDPVWLGGQDKRALTSAMICNWLVSLPAKFPHAIFVMFAAGYDWTQIFRDMDYETAWEIWNGLPWSERDNPTAPKPNHRRFALWGEFALRLYPGKYLELGKFKNRNQTRNKKGEFDFAAKIKIYDTFGFFQTSFLKAITGFGRDLASTEELEILRRGKSCRNEFGKRPLSEIMTYTTIELRLLARMMQKMRCGLNEFDLKLRNWHGAGCIAQRMIQKNRITDFYPELSATINVDDLEEPLAWGLRGYFGGRVDMPNQGVHNGKFWNYDISSAYPHILRQLPNMRNGQWISHSAAELLTPDVSSNSKSISGPPLNDLKDQSRSIEIRKYARSQDELQQLLKKLESFSLVSMVKVRFFFPDCHRAVFNAGHWVVARVTFPWFPLPIRSDEGAIYFPRYGEGIYMVEEVRGMLRWARRVYADAKCDEQPAIALLEAQVFAPVNDARPFKALVEQTFNERAKIVEQTNEARKAWEAGGKEGPEPYDVREKVLKLGLNSLYGKAAQSRGGRAKQTAEGDMRSFPPKEANPYYAAAVTAGTRAMLLDAGSVDPDAIILFATDGICSIRELPGLEIPESKTLGTWEASARQNGVFVKAGIYSHEPYEAKDGAKTTAGKRSTKMRGIRPSSLPDGMTAEQWLIEEVPHAWERDDLSLVFPYRAYKTFGAALASRKSWELAGHWIEGEREADIQRVSPKRDCRGIAREKTADGSERPGERRRAFALFDTAPAENPIGWSLSRPYNPEWIDGELAKRSQAEEERKTLECKGGFGFERD